jgi:hypothetical protein
MFGATIWGAINLPAAVGVLALAIAAVIAVLDAGLWLARDWARLATGTLSALGVGYYLAHVLMHLVGESHVQWMMNPMLTSFPSFATCLCVAVLAFQSGRRESLDAGPWLGR